MKGSRVETIEAARKEYAELLKEGWKKTVSSGVISRHKIDQSTSYELRLQLPFLNLRQ